MRKYSFVSLLLESLHLFLSSSSAAAAAAVAVALITVCFRRVRIITKSAYELRRVCPSLHIYQLGSHWTDFHEIYYWGLLLKSAETPQIWL